MNVTAPSTDLAFGPVKASGAGRDVSQQNIEAGKMDVIEVLTQA